MRKTCLDLVYRLAQKDERVFFVGSDLGYKTLDEFRNNIPDRFIMEGINEAHAIGLCAGLALEGNIVYFNTIATFITRRAYEQIIIDLCLHQANVRLIGNGGGLVYAPLGSTHLAFEDLAAMRVMPNMTIVAPADAEEMKRLMPQTLDWPGPIYIRLAKGYDPIVTSDDVEFRIGKALPMRKGDDALILTTGVALGRGLEAHKQLAGQGVGAAVIHLPTIKPLDRNAILEYADKAKVIVTVEEHSVIGGFGGAVAEILAEADFNEIKRFRRIGLPDAFPDCYGTQNGSMDKFGVSSEGITATVRQLLAS